jgi:putative ABC transport system permease protein
VLEIRTLSALLDMPPCDTPFSTAVRALPGVRGTTCTSGAMLGGGNGQTDVTGPDGTKVKPDELLVDFDFFDLFGIKPLAGRAFSRDFSGDAGRRQADNLTTPPSVMINETLSRALGFATPQSAVGQTIRWRPLEPSVVTMRLMRAVPKVEPAEGQSQIVGVVPDFSRGSVRQGIEPEIFWINAVGYGRLEVKLQAGQVPETLKAIDQLWKNAGQSGPINRIFLDQQIEDMYRDFTLLSRAMAAFAGVAVFVACLGLFGLATFAAESRTKEIGVRKALGANRADILRLMLWEFNKPVLWASLMAWPIAYFITRRWLEGFAVRVDIDLWTFPAATALTLAIAMLTVTGHALLVARSQPVKALRYE